MHQNLKRPATENPHDANTWLLINGPVCKIVPRLSESELRSLLVANGYDHCDMRRHMLILALNNICITQTREARDLLRTVCGRYPNGESLLQYIHEPAPCIPATEDLMEALNKQLDWTLVFDAKK